MCFPVIVHWVQEKSCVCVVIALCLGASSVELCLFAFIYLAASESFIVARRLWGHAGSVVVAPGLGRVGS